MMKKNMKISLVAGFLLLVSFPLFSQQNILRYADQEFALKRYEYAGVLLCGQACCRVLWNDSQLRKGILLVGKSGGI